MRVPHFIGLHALQAFALVAVVVTRWRRSEAVKATFAAAASYTSLFLLLLWGALRGQSVVGPDATMLAALAIWLATTVSVFVWIGATSSRVPGEHSSLTLASSAVRGPRSGRAT
jgi:hypothetical protein